MHLLLINPNATQSMTEKMRDAIQLCVSDNTDITAVSVRDAPLPFKAITILPLAWAALSAQQKNIRMQMAY